VDDEIVVPETPSLSSLSSSGCPGLEDTNEPLQVRMEVVDAFDEVPVPSALVEPVVEEDSLPPQYSVRGQRCRKSGPWKFKADNSISFYPYWWMSPGVRSHRSDRGVRSSAFIRSRVPSPEVVESRSRSASWKSSRAESVGSIPTDASVATGIWHVVGPGSLDGGSKEDIDFVGVSRRGIRVPGFFQRGIDGFRSE
jgi:hypothetical protein